PRLELVDRLSLVVPPGDPHRRGLLERLGRLAGVEARVVVGVDPARAGDPVEDVLQLVGGPLIEIARPLGAVELLAERREDRRDRLLAGLDQLALGFRAFAGRVPVHRERDVLVELPAFLVADARDARERLTERSVGARSRL